MKTAQDKRDNWIFGASVVIIVSAALVVLTHTFTEKKDLDAHLAPHRTAVADGIDKGLTPLVRIRLNYDEGINVVEPLISEDQYHVTKLETDPQSVMFEYETGMVLGVRANGPDNISLIYAGGYVVKVKYLYDFDWLQLRCEDRVCEYSIPALSSWELILFKPES
jgi:hypothetical protein